MTRIAMFQPLVTEQARLNVDEVLRSRWIGEGSKVKQFEEALRRRFGYGYCVALNNGTAALRLALAMCGVGPGDEVITVAQTCTATNTPILEQFAKPVFADIQYETGNIDPGDIAHRITERTRAIMCVHWAGYPCDLDEVHAVAETHGLPVIEDAAHALGAYYGNRPIGTISDFTMFSFQAVKQLTTGDGGLLTMQTQERYDEARRRRWFGIDRVNRVKRLDGYSHWDQSEVGYKYHMNDIAAAMGLGNLERISEILAQRQRCVSYYRKHLEKVPGVTLFECRDDRCSSNWLFTMHVERRDDFCRMMRDKEIEVSVVHIRNDEHSIFGPRRDDLPNTDRYAETNISIPLHNYITWIEADYVARTIAGGW